MQKTDYVFHSEWMELFEASELTDSEIVSIIRATDRFVKDGTEPVFEDRTVRAVWVTIRNRITYDAEQYEQKCEARRGAGKKGGAPKGNQNAKKNNQTVESLEKNNQNNQLIELQEENNQNNQTVKKQAKQADTDTDIDIDIDTDIDKTRLDYAPARETVKKYWSEKGYLSNPDRFWNYYEDKNWYKGKTDWRFLADEWEKREHAPATKPKVNRFANFTQRDTDYKQIEKMLLARG